MNQANSNTNERAVNPSPLFGSVWVALYCLLRDGQGTAVPAIESTLELDDKDESEIKRH